MAGPLGEAEEDFRDFVTLQPPEAAIAAARARADAPHPAAELRAYVVHQEPRITLVPGFVTDVEIAHLLDLAEASQAWVPSVVWRGGDAKSRNSHSFMLRSAQTT